MLNNYGTIYFIFSSYTICLLLLLFVSSSVGLYVLFLWHYYIFLLPPACLYTTLRYNTDTCNLMAILNQNIWFELKFVLFLFTFLQKKKRKKSYCHIYTFWFYFCIHFEDWNSILIHWKKIILFIFNKFN